MPLVHVSGKLLYFAHVPRAAGTAVENYLRHRFGPLGLLDRAHLSVPPSECWTRSSPQHIDTRALNRLLPPAFFAASIAVVRDPVGRLASVFLYQRDIVDQIPKEQEFLPWLDTLQDQWREAPFALDNHTRPMSDFVPDGAEVFRLEDGLDRLVAWLDRFAGEVRGPRVIQPTNSYAQRLEDRKAQPSEIEISDEVRAKIRDLYARDYERFDYA